MTKANETQVGGDHYKNMGHEQHWDLVLRYEWDYFQGQIIKYVMRWKTKHATPEKRLQDLKKARHFLDKYIEAEQDKLELNMLGQAMSGINRGKNPWWINADASFHCANCDTVHRRGECPTEPGRGYVNQG